MRWRMFRVPVSARQREALEGILRRRSAPQQLVTRTRCVLLASESYSNAYVGKAVGATAATVAAWCRRWQEVREKLQAVEQKGDLQALMASVEEALGDRPRPGAPPKFSAEQVVHIIKVACEPPEESQRPVSHWTARELAEEVVQRKIVPSISARQVGRFLKSGRFAAASHALLAELGTPRPRAIRATSGAGL